jgi:hypothetical protein
MNAISLWQPWASLIACGAKPYETRDYPPPADWIGKAVAIHAAKMIDKVSALFADALMRGEHGQDVADKLFTSIGRTPDSLLAAFGNSFMPVGCVVATATLDAAFLLGEPAEGTAVPGASVVRRMVSRPMPDCFTVRTDPFGDYTAGRWAWLFKDVKPLDPPPPAIGRQKFFNLELAA